MVSGQRHHAETLRERASDVLALLGLHLAPEKTRVVHIDEGLDFLGFHIRWLRKHGTDKHYAYTIPSKAIKRKVSAQTYRSTLHKDPAEVIATLNRMLRGWANYFRYGVSRQTFSHVDSHAWCRLTGWIYRKHSRRGWRQLQRRFCVPGSWKITHNGVVSSARPASR
ncbi:group II intron maturase-specific domain-containing protein [Amycolatopsis sp. NPDC059090]|uniref:group II intron maturase-specific domain-containing protein n=1 Tax=Amycolatopsis sp. NPDC059090 TaxID=3346723 RepID=UPI0036718E1A